MLVAAIVILALLGVIGALFNEGAHELPSDLDRPTDNTTGVAQ